MHQYLNKYASKNCPKEYYKVRGISTVNISPPKQAARFIYMNKSAFNGIYRVNMKGQFNVPYGPSTNGPALPSANQLKFASHCLRKSKILCGDFEDILKNAIRGDFIYLDPPYPPSSETAYFTHYTPGRFAWKDQIRVAKVFHQLSKKGCFVMLSNADQPQIRSLYAGFTIYCIDAIRWLGANGDRYKVREIVITNYKIGGY